MSKSETIGKIFKLTGRPSEKYFDKLNDYSAKYLEKLLKVIEKLK